MGGSTTSSTSTHRNLDNLPKDGQILLMAAPPPKKVKHQSPQDSIDEFWAKFNSKTPGKAFTILPKNEYAKRVGDNIPKGVIKGNNAVASYEEAADLCRSKVEKIAKECRRVNQKYRDPHFDIDFDLKWGTKDCLTPLSEDPNADASFQPGSVKRVGDIFDNPQFYVSGATANDIRQGRDGDCWFMAALATLGNKPGLIEKVCVARDEKIGVYGFVFHRDGEWRSEIIDDKLYLTKPDYDESWVERNLIEDRQRINSEEDYRKIYQSNSGALYFAQCEDPNETWLPLLEKAYAKAHGDYAAIEGGFTGEGLEDLTGGVTTEVFSTDILDKEYFWKEELLKVNQEFLFGCAAGVFRGRGYRKGIYEGHAYSILRAVEIDGMRLVLLRNPWGKGEWTGPWSDGGKEWTPEWMQKLNHRFGDDGSFWMSYQDLLRKFELFDRTRLFSDDWKVTQQWTSLSVPWTCDYHTTKFSITLEKKAPVMIVLSQLDDRYFVGLQGEYSFEISFRVHKAGEEDYIVRSHGNYWRRRSVTAELELEAGEYHILMKVVADRYVGTSPVETIVRNNAKNRRNKLLRIGLAYDLAHAKGKIIETDEEKKGRKASEAKKKAKEMKEMKEKLMKEKKKRRHNENKEKRKVRAAKVKREEKAKAKAEKKKVEQEKVDREKSEKAKETKLDSKDVSEKHKKDEESETKEVNPEQATEKGNEKEINSNSKTAEASTASSGEKASEKKEAEKSSTLENQSKDKEAEKNVVELTSVTTENLAPGRAAGNGYPADDDDDSDLESTVSDITNGAIEDELAAAKLAADSALPIPLPPMDDEEDEFERDPWNAVAIVGLRVYSKESGVTVKVIRRKDWENGESGLDVDDSAKDATIDLADNEKKDEDEKKAIIEKKDNDEKEDENKEFEGSQKGEANSESSESFVTV